MSISTTNKSASLTTNLNWILPKPVDKKKVEAFAKEINIPSILAEILINRGVDNFDKAKMFFRPKLEFLYNPFLMKGMENAVERIITALMEKEKILVYGDYDVDGTTGASLLYMALKELGGDISFHIPDRHKEGYGISEHGIKKAISENTKLIISVDCGITAIREVELAKGANIDIVICDHHEPSEIIPKALAVLDPKQKDCPYPFKELCGGGVAFKLLQGIYQKLKLDTKPLEEYLDLVAIGSSADIVPLVDENRILVSHGLEKINARKRVGVKTLLESAGLSGEINSGQIVFVVAPRVNAVGRMGDATRAVKLFTAQDENYAKEIAKVLEEENKNRKSVDEETLNQAIEMVEREFDPEEDSAIVLHKENWHQGVIGIVAARLVEKYYRPTIMIAVNNGIGKGSARSIPGFDIYLALRKCEDLMMGFGGHKYAAGLSIAVDKIERFKERFRTVAKQEINKENLAPHINIDAEITLDDITPRFLKILKMFSPFGPNNMKPIFLTKNVEVSGIPSIVGENHLKFKVKCNGMVIDAIGFGMSNFIERLKTNKGNLSLVYSIEENNYMGRETIQLRIRDLR